MNQPPPLPRPGPYPGPQPGPSPENLGGIKTDPGYNLVADKIGGVPNLRTKDNLCQALCVLAFLVIGVAVGFIWKGPEGALIGALVGLVAGLLLSGAVLMVIGLRRKP